MLLLRECLHKTLTSAERLTSAGPRGELKVTMRNSLRGLRCMRLLGAVVPEPLKVVLFQIVYVYKQELWIYFI